MVKQIYGWFCIALGLLAMFGSLSNQDFYAFTGGFMFLVAGWMILDSQFKLNFLEKENEYLFEENNELERELEEL